MAVAKVVILTVERLQDRVDVVRFGISLSVRYEPTLPV